MPKRVQRKRSKNWRMPKGSEYVGRPTIWGNPFRLDDLLEEWRLNDRMGTPYSAVNSRKAIVEMYRHELMMRKLNDPQAFDIWISSLKGKDLVCWCPLNQPCHADVLLELANE